MSQWMSREQVPRKHNSSAQIKYINNYKPWHNKTIVAYFIYWKMNGIIIGKVPLDYSSNRGGKLTLWPCACDKQ